MQRMNVGTIAAKAIALGFLLGSAWQAEGQDAGATVVGWNG